MSDPNGLETRLRAALGGENARHGGAAHRGGELDAARSQVLGDIRRRRMRRMQAMGGAVVVALGLAVTLPQVLSNTSPSTRTTGNHASAINGASVPSTHAPAVPTSESPALHAVVLTATCRVKARTVSDCGTLATNAAAAPLNATASSLGKAAPAFANVRSTAGLGSPLVVRAGTVVLINLPRMTEWRWGSPTVLGRTTKHGPVSPVTVRASTSGSTTQQFLVTTRAPATVVLEAQNTTFAGKGATPSIVAGSAVWALELKVEGK